MNLQTSEWFELMKNQVSEVLAALAMVEAAFVGYIRKDIGEVETTIAFTNELVTVTASKYKWEMPILWFTTQDYVDIITKMGADIQPQPRAAVPGVFAKAQERVSTLGAAGIQTDEPEATGGGPDDAYETVGGDDSMLGGIGGGFGGVRSAAEIAAEIGD